jgi:hypothetical protein
LAQAHRLVEDGQGGRPRKSNFTRPGFSTSSLSNWLTADSAPAAVQRAEIGELARRDQHATGVHADVAGEALELFRQSQQFADLLLASRRAR